jgi:hypothetical protein
MSQEESDELLRKAIADRRERRGTDASGAPDRPSRPQRKDTRSLPDIERQYEVPKGREFIGQSYKPKGTLVEQQQHVLIQGKKLSGITWFAANKTNTARYIN